MWLSVIQAIINLYRDKICIYQSEKDIAFKTWTLNGVLFVPIAEEVKHNFCYENNWTQKYTKPCCGNKECEIGKLKFMNF